MEIQYQPIEPEGAHSLRKEIVSVYGAAFSQPPYFEKDYQIRDFEATLERHLKRPGFKAWIARVGPQGSMVGFSYGYASRPGSWWYEHVARGMHQEVMAEWLIDAFELVELAVMPDWQGQGIGSRLLDTLLEGLTYHTAVLSTWPGTKAEKLYLRRGWTPLLEGFSFITGGPKYSILGKKLLDKIR